MSRLDNLVCVLAPVLLRDLRYQGTGAPTREGEVRYTVGDLDDIAQTVVRMAVALDRAIADEELRQMTPPKG